MKRHFEFVIIVGLSYYVLCSIITAIYLSNVGDLALPWAWEAFAGLFFASVLFGFAVSKAGPTIRYGFIALASYILIRDIVAPFPSITIDSGSKKITYQSIDLILDVGAAFAALVLALALARFSSLRKLAAIFFAVFVAVDVATNIVGLVKTGGVTDSTVAEQPATDKPNVYHLVFDGFPGSFFLETAEQLNVLDEFDGFILFDKAKANHYPTYASMASMMLSEYFSDTNETFSDWIFSWKKPDAKVGLLNKMTDGGYALHQYTDIPVNAAATPSQTRLTSEVMSRVNLIQAIYAARLSPVAFRQTALDTVSEYLSQMRYGARASSPLDYRAWDSPRLFSTMVAGESGRPNTGQYVFYHGFNPHGPHPVQLDCTPTETQSSFNALGCSINSMLELIRELKVLGRYDDALIVIHSDHGNNRNEPNPGGEYFDIEFSKAFNQYFWYPESPVGGEINHYRMVAPLLLVKLPGSKQPFRIDHRELAEIADIGPTIYAAAGLPVETKRGAPLFSEKHASKREISMFLEVLAWRGNRMEDGRPKPAHEWEMPYLIYRPGDRWELRPAVPLQ